MAHVVLISSDGLSFSFPVEAAHFSTVISEKLRANNGREFVVVNHKGNSLRHVVNFLSQIIIGDEESRRKMKCDFLYASSTRIGELFETLLAAYDLGIRVLEDLMCERIADKIEDMTPELVRAAFESDADLTPEQKAFTISRYRFAFEGADGDVAQGEGSESVPAPPPSESAPATPPSESASAPQPSESAPAPQPSESAPAPRPSESAPAPRPSESAPAPRPSEPAPAPRPSESAPAPRPSESAPASPPSESTPTSPPSESTPAPPPSE